MLEFAVFVSVVRWFGGRFRLLLFAFFHLVEGNAPGLDLQGVVHVAAGAELHAQALNALLRHFLGTFFSSPGHSQAERAEVAQADGAALLQCQDDLLLQGGEHSLDVVFRHGAIQGDELGHFIEQHGIAEHDGRIPFHFVVERVFPLDGFVVYHTVLFFRLLDMWCMKMPN